MGDIAGTSRNMAQTVPEGPKTNQTARGEAKPDVSETFSEREKNTVDIAVNYQARNSRREGRVRSDKSANKKSLVSSVNPGRIFDGLTPWT